MRVTNNPSQSADAASQAHQAKRAGKVSGESKTNEKSAPTEIEGDSRPEISTRARDMAKAKEIASNAPDVREAKIAQLKERIAAGKYNVDAHDLADRMVDEHLSSHSA